jgi:CAAX protease family protein
MIRLRSLELPTAALVSALLFAAVHIAVSRQGAASGEVLFIVLGAFVLGLLAGWLRSLSGSLLPAIVVHALFNMIAG